MKGINRYHVIIAGLIVLLLLRQVSGDTTEAFAAGGFVGLVGGVVLGICFVWGEWPAGESEKDTV